MKEVLFRGQRIDNGEWVYGFYVETLDIKNEDFLPPFEKKKYIFTSWEESLLSNEDNGGIFEIKPESIGQFTGLLDKNGNEIFEGDLIQTEYTKGSIHWNEQYLEYYIQYELDSERFYLGFDREIEIIGNIHENK